MQIPNASWREPFLNVVRGIIVEDWFILKCIVVTGNTIQLSSVPGSRIWSWPDQGGRKTSLRKPSCSYKIEIDKNIWRPKMQEGYIYLVLYMLSFSLTIVGGWGMPEDIYYHQTQDINH